MTDPFGTRSEITAEEYRHWVDRIDEAPTIAEMPQDAPKTPRGRETAFRDAVVALARFSGWMVYFTQRSDKSPAGFPDLVLVRGGWLIFAELKVPPNTPTPSQQRWLAALGAAGALTHVWTPDDWRTIEEVLADGTTRL